MRQGLNGYIGGAAYLAEVAQSVPDAHNATHYAEIVRNKATVRELIHASTEILSHGGAMLKEVVMVLEGIP